MVELYVSFQLAIVCTKLLFQHQKYGLQVGRVDKIDPFWLSLLASAIPDFLFTKVTLEPVLLVNVFLHSLSHLFKVRVCAE